MDAEHTGRRDLIYSGWHRRASTRRFIGKEQARFLAMIDLDGAIFAEYEDGSKEPLVLIETARDVGQEWKSARVTANLARRAGLPAYVVLYEPSNASNPADSRMLDIRSFRVKRVWPRPEAAWRKFTPQQWALKLLSIRACAAATIEAANDQSYCDGTKEANREEQTDD